MKSILHKRYFGIKGYEYIAVVGFYFTFAYIYHLALFFNRLSPEIATPYSQLVSVKSFMDHAGLQYLMKFTFSTLVYIFVLRKMVNIPLLKRMWIHFLILPIWIILCQKSYYALADLLEWGHLRGAGSVWDIYIPALFYVLQFGLLHAYEGYHLNERSLKQKARLSEAALKSELAALKAQLNPHFLYNTFNTISASVPSENETTRELIAKLADLFRYQLKASKSELVPLHDELEFVEKYLDLEKARFEDRLKVTIDVDQELRKELVPPMILQPLVENSLHHGLSSLIQGGEVRIRIFKHDDKIQFEVSDTGVGVEDKNRLFNVGLGLTNTKLRLEKMYGSELKISDNNPRGLKIEFAI